MTSQRLSEAATRSLIFPVAWLLYGIWKHLFRIEIPPNPRTVMLLFIVFVPWMMVSIWQARSRVENWSWFAIGLGYMVCFIAIVSLSLLSARLFQGF